MFARNFFRNAILSLWLLVGTAQAAVPEIEVNVEKRDDTFLIDTTFEIPVPLRTAWGVLTDFDNMANILHNLTSSRIANRSGNTLRVQQAGVARFGIFTFAFTSEREVRLEPMKRIHVRQIAGNTKRYVSEMELSPNGSGTHFRYHAEMALESGIARFFGGPFIQHEIGEQFVSMAAEMEKRQAK